MKKGTKLNPEPMTIRFTGGGKTISLTSIDEVRLAAVAEDWLKSNGVRFEKVVAGEEADDEEKAEGEGEKEQEEADRENDLGSDR